MGKFKMPNAQGFLKKKRIFGPIKDPVWVYIRRELKQNGYRRPNANKVLNWLLFLKDLRYHYYCEAKRQYNRLFKKCGPEWYSEYSIDQKTILQNLKADIHEDLLEGIPSRVKKDLWDLGITLRFPADLLIQAMTLSYGDTGLFLWRLYEAFYKKSPSELLPRYDLNAMLMMSALVFVDIDECVMELEKLTTRLTSAPEPIPKKKQYYFEPNVKYGMYLQRLRIPVYSPNPSKPPKPQKPPPIACKIRLRSPESYEMLKNETGFLEKRKKRNLKEKLTERHCDYKFWEPPALFGSDKKTADLVLKMKMVKLHARPRYLKYKPPINNIQCVITGVAYSRNKPIFILQSYTLLSTGYTIINGGLSKIGNEYVTQICDMWNDTHIKVEQCNKDCNCLKMWNPTVVKYLETTRCHCGHFYDFEGGDVVRSSLLPKETFFYPPTRDSPFLFDHAKIYQLDEYVEFINHSFKKALASESTPPSTISEIELYGLPSKQLLQMFLADLVDTPLLIPHLPEAHHLNNLLEWVRKRVRGKTSAKKDKQLMLKSQRRWLQLSHIDFRAKAYYIPFTLKQLEKLNWSHRKTIQDLSQILLRDFELRTRKEMLEHTRLFWATMMNDVYPSEAFIKAFFSYMPGRLYDTLVVNPYSVQNTPTSGAKTCILEKLVTIG